MTDHFIENEEERIGLIRHKLKFVTDRPEVLCLECLDPPVSAGPAVAEIIRTAGGIPVPSDRTGRLLTEAELQEVKPAVLILMPSGMELPHTLQKMSGLLQQDWFTSLPAVQQNRVYLADERYGRTEGRPADHIELFAEMINPGDFYFGLEGKAWMKFSI